MLRTVESFFADACSAGRSTTLLSLWPTPDHSPKGWSLVGHPAMVLRSPGPTTHERAPGVEARLPSSAEEFAAAERIAIDGYPFNEAKELPPGSLFPPALAHTPLVVRLGLLDSSPSPSATSSSSTAW